MKILLILEQRSGNLKSSSRELAAQALALAEQDHASVEAVIVGDAISGACAALGDQGISKVYAVEHADLAHYHVTRYVKAVCTAVEAAKPNLILTSASPTGKDLLPRLAAKLNAPIVSDVTHLSVEGGKISARKPIYAGKAIAKLSMPSSAVALASLRPNSFTVPESVPSTSAQVESLSWGGGDEVDSKLTVKELRKGSNSRVDLSEAAAIVSGGRSMGSKENFSVLEPLADALGASIGASRAAVDAGYASHDMQVGQTGKTVNPNLYIACGISGAIQHLAGMRTSKVIVAINKDPEAPIFKIADYGIVADLFEAVPEMAKSVAALKE